MGAGRSLMRVENEGDQVEVLTGGNMGAVTRVGGTVHRMAGEWTPAVHRLLRHCREAGFSALPEPLGITDDGHEILSFVEGTVPSYPMPAWIWSREALDSSARLMREYHDATTGCDLSGPWRSPSHEPVEVICHYDFAPYNIAYQHGGRSGLSTSTTPRPGHACGTWPTWRTESCPSRRITRTDLRSPRGRRVFVGCSRSTGRLPPQPISWT